MQAFDPFENRLARDLRNSLATALTVSLNRATAETIEERIRWWLQYRLPPAHCAYLLHTRARYQRAINETINAGLTDARHQIVVLWNHRLYFEVHEVLESIWHTVDARERQSLKGLIQAAGVQIHRMRGSASAAKGLARRAQRHLKANRSKLGYIGNLTQLIRSLDTPSRPPPQLQLVHQYGSRSHPGIKSPDG